VAFFTVAMPDVNMISILCFSTSHSMQARITQLTLIWNDLDSLKLLFRLLRACSSACHF